MPHYGILRDHKMEDVDDLRGADVYGVNDEKLGTIDDVIFDHSSGDIRYIVLKTGGLLSRKKVMVPANRVEPYGNHDDKFYAELDKERLEMLPEFNDETLKSHSKWSKFEREHNKRWHDGAVMYNRSSGRIITPPPEDVVSPPMGSGSASSSMPDLTPEKMGKEDDLLGVASGTGKTTLRPKKPSIGGKEDVEMMRRGQREAAERERQTREVMNPVGEELEFQREEPGSRSEFVRSEAIGEPGVYKLDPIVETEQGAGPTETENIDLGRRWNAFQASLRTRREAIVVECPRCASQDKAA
ncbi:MAG TPA: PRC-barrel domain-containing protein [Candidatus Angelobacter sp.]